MSIEFRTTGKIIEAELFGGTREKEGRRHNGYLTYASSLEVVKATQGNNDPTDPEWPFANDLHATIAQELCPDAYDQLKFYTAIGSPLDFYHGVDGVIEFSVEGGDALLVTIDVTTNPEKDAYKADIIVQVPFDGLDREVDKDQYGEAVIAAAQQVIEALKLKLAKEGTKYAA